LQASSQSALHYFELLPGGFDSLVMSKDGKPNGAPLPDHNNTPLPREKLHEDLQKIVDDEETLLDQIYDGT
jgi:hypothetical protein